MSDFVGYMCKTDFEHDVRGSYDGALVFPSEKALRENRRCVDECGIVEVRLSLTRVVQDEDLSAYLGDAAQRTTTA